MPRRGAPRIEPDAKIHVFQFVHCGELLDWPYWGHIFSATDFMLVCVSKNVFTKLFGIWGIFRIILDNSVST